MTVAVILIGCSGTANAKPMDTYVQPILTYSGTTANCYVKIVAFGKTISAELQLWHGSTMIASWSDTATNKLTISETYGVSHNETYTLIVTGTINSVPFSGQGSAVCP